MECFQLFLLQHCTYQSVIIRVKVRSNLTSCQLHYYVSAEKLGNFSGSDPIKLRPARIKNPSSANHRMHRRYAGTKKAPNSERTQNRRKRYGTARVKLFSVETRKFSRCKYVDLEHREQLTSQTGENQ